jgi:hypothetical protein
MHNQKLKKNLKGKQMNQIEIEVVMNWKEKNDAIHYVNTV